MSQEFIDANKKYLDPDGDGCVDLTGGWHDAGDHVKFGLPGSYSAATLGWGYYEFRDAYEKTGQNDHIETILRYFNDYLMKCTFLDSNGDVIAHCYQVGDGDIDHAYWNAPELDEMDRPAYFLTADKPQTDALLGAKVKGVAYETLIERNGSIPLLAPMSQIAGRLSIQEGAKYLEKRFGGEGVLLAGVPGTPKANIVILGGGSVGTNACKIAVGMGANVTIMDINLQRLAYLDDIFGARIQTLVSNDANIEKAVKEADLVIGCVLIPGKSAPKIFKKKYLKEMKPGAVFVDVAVDQGGCGETTKVTYHDDPIFIEDGVVHYCVGNMPGAVPRTSTIALTNATLSYGLQIAGKGLEQACKDNEVIYSAINTYDGKLTCKNVADSFDCYEYTDIKSVC